MNEYQIEYTMTGMTIIQAKTDEEALDIFDNMTMEEKKRDLSGETNITIFDGDFLFDENDFERFIQGWIDTIQRYEEDMENEMVDGVIF